MSNPIGLSVLLVHPISSPDVINKKLKALMRKTPSGRCCVVVYQISNKWEANKPIESIALTTVLGSAGNRTEDDEWEFFANLAVRLCEPQKNKRQVNGELGIIIFKRKGEKIYERRHEMPPLFIEESLIPTLHPVFTRDVANNIWHMRPNRSLNHVVDRLSVLLSWPDEHTIVSRLFSTQSRPRAKPNYDNDLIGLPQKEDYEWVTKQPSLPFPT